MPTFTELQAEAPTIAAFLGTRIAKTGLCLLATTRHDGWPRVSPMEVSVIDGRFYVGSMPDAVKAKDLQRDPRCCLSRRWRTRTTSAARRRPSAGRGRSRPATSGSACGPCSRRPCGFDIGDPGVSHVFELSIESAAWQRVEGDDWRTTSWAPGTGVRERVRSGPTGASHDL